MTAPLPGWYQDPDQPTQQKWWDGREWSTYTMPLAAAEPPSGSPASGEQTAATSEHFIPSGEQADSSSPGASAGYGYPARNSPVEAAGPRPGYPAANSAEAGAPGTAQRADSYPGYSHPGTGYSGYSGPQGYPAYPGYPGYPQIFRTNPLALTGFILGLSGFFLFFIPIFGTAICAAAVVFSVVGLFKQRDRAPRYKVFGIIGLVLGIIFTLLSLLLTLALLSDLYYI
ncbi:DUF2510 domain-containing protein [Arthrobacter gengyunqii]|uniref:DUF2510 domain-containing protein n=1 Tax=Arthrobacter gengyunqii TaxID=2886940 RepID=A0A9X1M477_9MICC|nr:DUF2510 domain-containing protein [Arthrobacter gengyunqii]MCC3270545.1 DUF2510 domain-containing protein [Arthrobacter gengyunqii]UOY97407.1 DUF2510 domain-containing protein [Arthrobacter gengyunqii]